MRLLLGLLCQVKKREQRNFTQRSHAQLAAITQRLPLKEKRRNNKTLGSQALQLLRLLEREWI